MVKSAFIVILSALYCLLSAPVALATESSGSTASSKKHSKKSSVKHKAQSSSKKKDGSRNASFDAHQKPIRKVIISHGRRKVVYQSPRTAYAPVIPAVPPVLSAGDLAGLNLTRDPLDLKSSVALVLDQSSSQVLFEKNSSIALPIASITKLMTGLIVVEAHQNMDEILEITADDIDREKNSASRLRIGSQLTRTNMLHIALMSSENRAASALGRSYPGGLPAFVAAMNAKARALGMTETRYVDSTGLSSHNIASARDLAKLVIAAHQQPLLCQYSTDVKYVVNTGNHSLQYANSNHLVANPDWEIGLQKTGYISEAGRCLVMQTRIEGRPIVMVFLDSKGKQSRLADAGRIRKWLEALKTKGGFHGNGTPPLQS
jgi:serine-type D-Ala-D-Ala endopeptidase (penicillin-binding protein 7)